MMPIPEIVRDQKITKDKLRRAKEMRSDMTDTEAMLWDRIRNNQLGGLHFRRQQLIDGFIVDFYCHSANLVIEIDGPIHESQIKGDAIRDDVLAKKGLSVLHFRNDEVHSSINLVLERIQTTALSPLPLRQAKGPQSEGGPLGREGGQGG